MKSLGRRRQSAVTAQRIVKIVGAPCQHAASVAYRTSSGWVWWRRPAGWQKTFSFLGNVPRIERLNMTRWADQPTAHRFRSPSACRSRRRLASWVACHPLQPVRDIVRHRTITCRPAPDLPLVPAKNRGETALRPTIRLVNCAARWSYARFAIVAGRRFGIMLP